MPDTFTTNIELTNQEEGGNNNTWGTIADNNFERLDNVLGDNIDVTGLTGGTVALSDAQQFVLSIDATGTLTSNLTLTWDDGRGGLWIFNNATTGAYTVTCKTTSGAGVIVDQGRTQILYSDGTDMFLGNPDPDAVAEEAVASAATTDILGASSEFIEITGTTTITSLGTGANRKRFVRFSGTLTLTHNASSLILPGGANITTAAGDTMIVISDASSNARVYTYQRATGGPLTLGNGTLGGNATLSGNLTLSGTNTHSGANSFTSTSHMAVAGGTTGQRPGSPAEGDMRKNTTLNTLEFYDGTLFVNALVVPEPQGYLTLSSGTPVITSDQSAATTVYYAFDKGPYVPISDGSGWSAIKLASELSCGLDGTGHVADNIYDLYIWNDGGTIRLVTGVAWTTATAGAGNRGTGGGTAEITRLGGIRTNANSMAVRYGASTDTMGVNEGLLVGSILIDGTNGQATCHVSYGKTRRWALWNAYNRKDLTLLVGDSGLGSFNFSGTWRAANNDTANVGRAFSGLAEEGVSATYLQSIGCAGDNARVGASLNSEATPGGHHGHSGDGNSTTGSTSTTMAHQYLVPSLGLNTFTCFEKADTGSPAGNGGQDNMEMTVRWRG